MNLITDNLLVTTDQRNIILFFFLIFITSICFALPEDRQKTIQISAGSADLNQQTHRGIYLEEVRLDQGTTHIAAAEAITEGNLKNQLILAIAKGNQQAQAHYWVQTAIDKPPLHAYANTIYYYPERHLIELIGNARVEQGDNSFAAPKISYDTQQQHVISKREGDTRTTIIIHPEKHA